MSNLKRRVLLVLAVSVVFGIGLMILTLPHWWIRIGNAEPNGAMYRSWAGDVVFVIAEDSLADEYIFFSSTGEIGIPNAGQIHYTPLFAYSNEAPPPVVFSDNMLKVGTDMNILVDEQRLEFTTVHGLRIKADRNYF